MRKVEDKEDRWRRMVKMEDEGRRRRRRERKDYFIEGDEKGEGIGKTRLFILMMNQRKCDGHSMEVKNYVEQA